MKQKNTRLVFSTESGTVKNHSKKSSSAKPAGDGAVRVRREVKGRGGKTVTAIYGVSLPGPQLKELAAELKRACGTGGSQKDGAILLQGDYCDKVVNLLQEKGYRARRAGG